MKTPADGSRAPRLPVRVECPGEGGAGNAWEEATHLSNATPRGAMLTLARRPRLGQLLRLTLPPRHPRERGDGGPDSNMLWALVWAETEMPLAATDTPARHTVSVMFVENEDVGLPCAATDYVYEFEETGGFRLREQTGAQPAPVAATTVSTPARRRPVPQARPARPAERRKGESRLYVPFEVTVEALAGDGSVAAREQTVTENISRRGAAVWTTLALGPDERVRLTSERCGVTVSAVVRARRVGDDGIARLHLEFLDCEWPLEGLT